MSRATLDASVALAWLLGESRPTWVDALIADIGQGETDAAVPSHFWLEIGNTLSQARELTDDQALDGMLRLQAIGLGTLEIHTPLRLQALSLARETRLTMYDATYLALAIATSAPLATLDVRLGTVSASRGIAYPRAPGVGHEQGRISDTVADYADRAPDPVSVAAIGAALAELRRQHAAVTE